MAILSPLNPSPKPNPNPDPDTDPDPDPDPNQVEDLVRKNKEKQERAKLAASGNRAKMR